LQNGFLLLKPVEYRKFRKGCEMKKFAMFLMVLSVSMFTLGCQPNTATKKEEKKTVTTEEKKGGEEKKAPEGAAPAAPEKPAEPAK
jgi:hypothetical protein